MLNDGDQMTMRPGKEGETPGLWYQMSFRRHWHGRILTSILQMEVRLTNNGGVLDVPDDDEHAGRQVW